MHPSLKLFSCLLPLLGSTLGAKSPAQAQSARPIPQTSPIAAPRLLGNTQKAVTALLFSPDGNRLAVGSLSQIKFFDLQGGEASRDFYLGTVPITALSWSPDGKFLAVGGAAGPSAVQFVDPATGRAQKSIALSTAPTALRFSPDGKRLAVAGADENLRFYDLGAGTTGPALSGFKYAAFALAFTPDGKYLVAVGGGFPYLEKRDHYWWYAYPGWLRTEGEISTIDLATCTIAHQQPVPFGSSNCAITPDARTIAFAGGYAEASEIPVAIDEDFDTKYQWGLLYHLNQVRWMFLDQPNTSDYASQHSAGEAALGAPPVRNSRGRRVSVPSKIGALDIGIGVAGVVNTVRDVNLESERLGATWAPVGALALSPDGRTLGLPSVQAPTFALWGGGQLLDSRLLSIDLNTVSVAAFAPSGFGNGSRLALASGNAVYLWNER